MSRCGSHGFRISVATVCAAVALSVLLLLQHASAIGSAVISADVDTTAPGVQAAATYQLGVPTIPIDIVVGNADAIGAFEFQAQYDATSLSFQGYLIGPFLASTGRSVTCQAATLAENSVRIGCNSAQAPPPDGPSGSGILATLFFRPRFAGNTCLTFSAAATADDSGAPLPTTYAGGCLDILSATPTPISGTMTPTPLGSALIALDLDPLTPGIQGTAVLPSMPPFVQMDVVVQNADMIGAFEFELQFNSFALAFNSFVVGPFLGSTTRPVTCQNVITEHTIRIGCTTSGPPPPAGASGDGVLVSLYFLPLRSGDVCTAFRLVETAEIFGHPLPTVSQDACLTLPPPEPTPTPTPVIGMTKLPEGSVASGNADLSVPKANLFLCITGPCAGPGEGDLVVIEHVSNITTGDSNGDMVQDGLGAYEFNVEYDNFVVQSVNPSDIVFSPGGAGASRGPASCSFSLVLENLVRFGCVTTGPTPNGPIGDFDLAKLDLIPHPDLTNDLFPGNDNGVPTVIKDNGCELADVFGHPVLGSVSGGLLPACGDLAVTVRILEGDLNLDCKVDVTDEQLIGVHYASAFGSAYYSTWFDLEPRQHDLDIDIKDLQKVFGRDGSTCQQPIPVQTPVDPPAPFG